MENKICNCIKDSKGKLKSYNNRIFEECVNCKGLIEYISLSLDDIKNFCLQYDKLQGDYVESLWEGFSIYKFIHCKLYNSLQFNENDLDIWEEEMKNVQ